MKICVFFVSILLAFQNVFAGNIYKCSYPVDCDEMPSVLTDQASYRVYFTVKIDTVIELQCSSKSSERTYLKVYGFDYDKRPPSVINFERSGDKIECKYVLE